jgi:hypothetical protein
VSVTVEGRAGQRSLRADLQIDLRDRAGRDQGCKVVDVEGTTDRAHYGAAPPEPPQRLQPSLPGGFRCVSQPIAEALHGVNTFQGNPT